MSSALETVRLGVLDIGSNSVRFVIYEIYGAAFTPVYNEKVLAGLGRDLRQTGRLSERGKSSALAAIKRFKMIAQSLALGDILIGATAALRDAADAQAFIAVVKAETGLDISPISGAEEARLTALGLMAKIPDADGLAADLGGASLELIAVKDRQTRQGQTYPLGPFQVLGTDISNDTAFDVDALRRHIEQVLDARGWPDTAPSTLYLIGGAWRNLAVIYQARTGYPVRTLQTFSLSCAAALDHARWAYGPGRAKVLKWPRMSGRRAETLPFSALMLDILLTRLAPERIVISNTGLREGLIYDALPETVKSRDALFDGCEDFARGNLQGQNFASPLYAFLQAASAYFPRCYDDGDEDRLRRAACSLAGIGKGLHPDYQAPLVFEQVLYAPFANLTHKERCYLSLILFRSYTASLATPNDPAIALLLSDEDRRAADTYGAAIRLAVVASGRSPDLLKTLKLHVKDGVLTLSSDAAHKVLLTDRVGLRLQRLADLMELDHKIR